MNSIEISPEQEEKLIEIVKNLYPEIKNWWTWFEEGYDNHHICGDAVPEKEPSIFMHWFEFVFFYIAPKIPVNLADFIIVCNNYKINELATHPIDYLDEKFKELRK